MKTLPRYTKVLTLGASHTENALIGDVVLQEKVDGSQFRFGLNEDKEIVLGSRSVNYEGYNVDGMFKLAVDYIQGLESLIIKQFKPDTYFFSEYLMKEKHNVLNYERVPLHNLVLFDCLEQGKWVNRKRLETIAKKLKVDISPELWRGSLEKHEGVVDFLRDLIQNNMSFLGEEIIEGIVIKNYGQNVVLGGNVFPRFTKYVREEYKERRATVWKAKSPKLALIDYFKGFCTEARWNKAIQHFKELGILENEPKDIGPLIKEIQADIKEEEQENIKQYLYKQFENDIFKSAIKGFPQWYKDKLLENLK